VAPYVAAGAVPDLIRGVFITPARRVHVAAWPLPALRAAWPALVVVAGLVAAARLPRRWQWPLAVVLGLPLAYRLATMTHHPTLYMLTWASARVSIPLVVLCGTLLLIGHAKGPSAERLFVLLSVATWCSLVQFPFSASVYFCYVAPLAALAVLAVLSSTRAGPGPVAATVAAFFALFAVVSMNGRSLDTLGVTVAPRTPVTPLHLARAGLSVPLEDAETYDRLIPLVQRRAAGSPYAYAAPDCPEVTFLAGLRNPTRALFDVFDDSAGRADAVLRILRRDDVRVVALNADPEFSSPIAGALDSALSISYPDTETIGKFTVRWRP
jgi:hypothetical protein